jgi:hypothetical protein
MGVGSEPLSGNGMTGTVKALLVLQMLGLALMGFWLVKEYENNVYLRDYVHNTAWTYLPVLAFIATFTVALGLSEAYARVHGSKRVEPFRVAGQAPGPLLTSGFGAGSPTSQQDMSAGSVVDGPGEGSGEALTGASFAQIFDSRPPAVLKHVESSEAIEVYSPPPFPVIRRLEPARDPAEEESPRPSPRPLNRVGMPFGNALLPPPVIRQFGRRTVADDGEEDSSVVGVSQDEASPGGEETGSRREAARPAKPRAGKKKPEITSDLSNDLTGG